MRAMQKTFMTKPPAQSLSNSPQESGLRQWLDEAASSHQLFSIFFMMHWRDINTQSALVEWQEPAYTLPKTSEVSVDHQWHQYRYQHQTRKPGDGFMDLGAVDSDEEGSVLSSRQDHWSQNWNTFGTTRTSESPKFRLMHSLVSALLDTNRWATEKYAEVRDQMFLQNPLYLWQGCHHQHGSKGQSHTSCC